MADDIDPVEALPNELASTDIQPTGTGAASPNWDSLLEGLNKLNTDLGSKLDGIGNTVAESTKPPPAAPPNYEEMTNAELVAHVTGSLEGVISQAVEKALGPLLQQVNGIQTDLVTTRSGLELEKVQAQNKDFREWKDEMIALAKVHPTLSLQDVYRLAKSNDPAKAAKLAEKYSPHPPKPRPFGALTPGNGKAAEPALTGEAATRAAYREVMERHQGILPMLQDL